MVTKSRKKSNKRRNVLKHSALEFIEVGIPVFPCRPGGKAPLTQRGFKDASTDPIVVRSWWDKWSDANIGIPTGAESGLLVLDVDVNKTDGIDGEATLRKLEAKYGPLPPTYEILTGGGGRHLWFFYPEGAVIGNSAGRLGDGLDVRGEGGYVIAPPSVHESGRPYRWSLDGDDDDADIDEPPQWLIDMLTSGGDHARASQTKSNKIPKGQRNSALFSRACSLFRQQLSEPAVRDAIHRENAESCTPPLSDEEVEKLLASASVCTTDADAGDARPTIKVKAGELPRQVDDAEQVLIDDPGTEIYEHAGRLVSPITQRRREAEGGVTRERGAVVLRPMTPPRLTEVLTKAVRWTNWDGRSQREKVIDCPARIAGTLLSRHGFWRFPLLEGIVECPTLRDDGSVIDRPGYDEQSGLLLDFDSEGFPPISEQPTREEARAALETLKELLAGFPFDSDADKSVALAAILTALVRRSLRCAPLFAISTPTMGSGKTLLANLISLIVSGRDGAVMSQAKSGEEDQKRLLSILLMNDLIVVIDNVERPLGGDTLCAILTQSTYRDRILGENTVVTVPTNAMFIATGNNLTIQGDMTRRALLCTIDPRCERPDERHFKMDLRAHILAHRGELVCAALTVLRAYVVAGKPKQDIRTYGSFEAWSDFVRSDLVWLGEADPLDTRAKIEDADPVRRSLEAVLSAWWAVYEDESVTVAKLIRESDPNAGLDPRNHTLHAALVEAVGDVRGGLNPIKVGKWAQRMQGRIAGGYKLQRTRMTSSGAWRWQVVEVDQPDTAGGTGGTGGDSPRKRKKAGKKAFRGKSGSAESANFRGQAKTTPASPAPPGSGGRENCDPDARRRCEPCEDGTAATPFPVRLMVDSGAFSAWNKNERIDLGEYDAFLEASAPYTDTAVNLDVIPGSWDCSAEESAKQGWDNLKELERRGHHLMPVFHQDEDMYWLERMKGEGYIRIGISPRKRRGEETRRWIGDCFEILAKCGAGQIIKPHAFGMTNFDWQVEFPWYSCDSTSWLATGAYGGMHVHDLSRPQAPGLHRSLDSGRFVYVPYLTKVHSDQRCRTVRISDQSRDDRAHFDALPPDDQDDARWNVQYLAGLRLEEVADCDVARIIANISASRLVEGYLRRVHRGAFSHLIYAANLSAKYNAALSGISTVKHDHMPAFDDNWYESPPDAGWGSGEPGVYYGVPHGFFQPNRLLSYWYLKDKKPDFVRRYVSTGLSGKGELRDKTGDPFQPRFRPRRA